MNNKVNESYDSRVKNASHDQSRNSAFLSPEKSKYMKDDKGEEGDPSETLKETFAEAKRLLINGNDQLGQVNEICMKALKDATTLFGENCAESLPGYFILAEANIAQKNLKRAEDFLIAAYWNLLKHSQDEKQAAGNNANLNQKNQILDEREYMMYKGTLHKVFSKLHLAKKEYDKALDEIKNGIYIDSCQYGPEDVNTSISYLNLGQIFVSSGEFEKGYSFFNQGIKIWYKFFKVLLRNGYSQVDELLIKQGLTLLKPIEAIFLERLKSEEEQIVMHDINRLNYALAFMYKYNGEEELSMEYCRNVEGYLMRYYDPHHPKLQRFYNFFPNYRENSPREGDYPIDDQNNRSEFSEA